MRKLEIIIPILLALYLVWPHPRPIMIGVVPVLAMLITLIHFYLERYRWQMVPLYVLSALLTINCMMNITSQTDWPATASYLTVILLLLSSALPILLPVPYIPDPNGPLQVGTIIFELADESRKEIYSSVNKPRRFMVQIWYPAEPLPNNKTAPWMARSDIFGPALSMYLHFPSFFLDHLALSNTPAFLDAPIAETSRPYPIILFSHGWNGFNVQNSDQMIELASRGYVVISVNHTYGALVTIFPDGEIIKNNPTTLPDNVSEDEYEIAARKLAHQWASDLAYTLDNFSSKCNFPSSSLDFEHVGVYGHSTGGGAAIQFCGFDPRCKAVLGMDPFMQPVSIEVIKNGLSQTAFFMFSQGWADLSDNRTNQLFNQFHLNLLDSKGAICINDTKHYDFTDLPLFSPIASQLGLKGPLNGKRVTEIVNTYLIEFFEMSLNNKPSTLFEGGFDDFNEVRVM
jgi:predicted dienelactone hydrolase